MTTYRRTETAPFASTMFSGGFFTDASPSEGPVPADPASERPAGSPKAGLADYALDESKLLEASANLDESVLFAEPVLPRRTPVTDAGLYLRSAARDDAPSRLGSTPHAVDTAARRLWEIAFGLVVRRRFEPDSPLAEIGRTVAIAVREHAAAAIPMLDAEMLVRAELGEIVPTGELTPAVRVAVHLLLFATLVDELALGDGELDGLIVEAEELAAGEIVEPS